MGFATLFSPNVAFSRLWHSFEALIGAVRLYTAYMLWPHRSIAR